MYTPSNNLLISTLMRWPVFTSIVATVGGIAMHTYVGLAVAWVASVALGAYGATKMFNEQLCDCEGHARRAGLAGIPKLNWVVEYHPESGKDRPWELYSMIGDDEDTKQHYASYKTEEHALARKTVLEGVTDKGGD